MGVKGLRAQTFASDVQALCGNDLEYQLDPYHGNLTKASVLSTSGVNITSFRADPATGIFTFTSVSLTNYKGFGTITVKFTLGRNTYEVELKVIECCVNPMTYDHIFIDETIPSGSYTGIVFMYGTNTVAGSVTFDMAEVKLATDAEIVVPSGTELIVDQSDLTKLCEYAWDRIYVEDNQAAVEFISSTLSESLRGVYTEDGGQVSASSTVFSNNVMSLYINNHNGSGPYSGSYIEYNNCDFTFSRFMTPMNIHSSSPINMQNYLNQTCETGADVLHVLIENSSGVKLGDQSLTNNEFFNGSGYGADMSMINMQASEVYVQNNLIYDGTVSNCAQNGSELICGGANIADGNTVEGIMEIEASASWIEKNTIKGDMNITNPTNNLVSGTYTGTNVLDNDFVTTGTQNVIVSNNNTARQVRFINNDFDRYTLSVAGIDGTVNNRLIVNDNTFSSLNSISVLTFVDIENCNNLVVGNNTIDNYSGYSPAGTAPFRKGIVLDDATDAEVYLNTLKRMDYGIEVSGDASNMKLYCNTIETYYNGIFLNSPTSFPDQGDASNGSDNKWDFRPSGSSTIAGAVSPAITFYWRPFQGATTDPEPNIWNPNGIGISATGVSEFETSPTVNTLCNVSVPNFKRGVNNESSEDSVIAKVEEQNNTIVQIFPNPGQDVLKINFSNTPGPDYVKVFNSSGQYLFNLDILNQENQFNISGLPSGIYFLQVGSTRHRLLKL